LVLLLHWLNITHFRRAKLRKIERKTKKLVSFFAEME